MEDLSERFDGGPLQIDLVSKDGKPAVLLQLPTFDENVWVMTGNTGLYCNEIKSAATTIPVYSFYDLLQELLFVYSTKGFNGKALGVQLLIDHGVDPQIAGFWYACWSGSDCYDFCTHYLHGGKFKVSRTPNEHIDDLTLRYFGKTDELYFYGINK